MAFRNEIRALRRAGLVGAALALASAAPGAFQGTWSDPGTSVLVTQASADYLHDDPPTCAGLVGDIDLPPAPGFQPGFAGRSYGGLHSASVLDSDPGCRIRAAAYARATVDGVGTSTADIRWKSSAEGKNSCECPPGYFYDAGGAASLHATIELVIDTVPPGEPVTVHWAWWGIVNCFFDPEENPVEDPAQLINVMLELQSTSLIPPGSANFFNQRALALLPPSPTQASGSFPAHGGDTISVLVHADLLARIAPDPDVPFLHQDASRAQFNGQLLLSIDDPLPPLSHPGIPGSNRPEFSLDLGSDAEMSDPVLEGNEVVDPGDSYVWFGPPLPGGGADGLRDDALAFLTDFWPVAPDGPLPVTGAPTCSGLSPADVDGVRFDLDGSDALDASLRTLLPSASPLTDPLPRFPSSCVWDDPFLSFSYDDDGAGHYVGGLPCSVPSEQASELGLTYGSTSLRDEVLGVSTAPLWPPPLVGAPTLVGAVFPLASEVLVHPSLGPNPDLGELADDDVDALDADSSACGVWYVSADHEATGVLPGTPFLLDPGDVYEVLPLGGMERVVDDVIHLGLPDATDVDAFEFVWMPACVPGDPASCLDALALLFSVDQDDPLTPGSDESGGLDPAMIYASHLDGTHVPYLPFALAGDVDAIAASGLPPLAPGTAAPIQDECFRAALVGGGITPFTNLAATTDGPPEACNAPFTGIDDADLWFEYVVPCNGRVRLHVPPTGFEPLLAVYRGDCPQAGGVLARCGSAVAGQPLTVRLLAKAGERLVIRIGAAGGTRGSGLLDVSCRPLPVWVGPLSWP